MLRGAYFLLVFFSLVEQNEGHGYLEVPQSRNLRAHEDGLWWVPQGSPPAPEPESCPHCLNRKRANEFCGTAQNSDHNYDIPRNTNGAALAPVLQATYVQGSIIQVNSRITAHHMGHFELRACPAGRLSHACFAANKLTFVRDLLYNAPVDTVRPRTAAL